jgi:hypothetical protein
MAGIHEHGVIDAIAEHPQLGWALILIEDRPWTDLPTQLDDLDKKLAAYSQFILDGQFYDVQPEAAGLPVSLVLRTQDAPAAAIEAVERTQRIVNEALAEQPPRDLVELATRLLSSTIGRLKPTDNGFTAFVVAVAADGAESRTDFATTTLEDSVREAWNYVETLAGSHHAAIVFDGFLNVGDERRQSAFAYVAATGADRSFRFAQAYGTQGSVFKRVAALGPVTLISADEPLVLGQ